MIFVTGGTGMLGAHLIYDLITKGERVRALFRSNKKLETTLKTFSYYSTSPKKLLDSVDWVQGDILDYDILEESLIGVNTIYHAAAMVSFDPKKSDEMIFTNKQGTANIVNAALKYKNIKLCHISSIATLEKASNNGFITESAEHNSKSKTTPYGLSKYYSEMEVWRGVAEGLSAVILNPSIILGPGTWSENSMKLFSTVHNGLNFYTSGGSAYIYVKDVVQSAQLLINSDINGERYIISTENLPYKWILDTIAKYLDTNSPRISLPEYAFSVAVKLQSTKTKLFGGTPIITQNMQRSAYSTSKYSNEKFLQSFDYIFTPIENTINEIAQHFIKDHHLS